MEVHNIALPQHDSCHACRAIVLGIKGGSFGFEAFMAGAFLNAIPGIILQLIFIPVMMVALDRTGMVRFTKSKAKCAAKAE